MIIAFVACLLFGRAVSGLRPPAVPLSANHPFFSIWSPADNLYDNATIWGPNGDVVDLSGIIHVDGVSYRYMGGPESQYFLPKTTVRQIGLQVLPTQTIYSFAVGTSIHFNMTWVTPMLPNDWETMARPITYIMFDVASVDNRNHSVSIYFDTTCMPVVSNEDTVVGFSRGTVSNDTVYLNMGALQQQDITTVNGADRVDYGWVYLAASKNTSGLETVIQTAEISRSTFSAMGQLPKRDWDSNNGSVSNGNPVLAMAVSVKVIHGRVHSRLLLLGNDQGIAIDYFNMMLPPYWNRNNIGAPLMLDAALNNATSTLSACAAFDSALMSSLLAAGGNNYSELAALSFRQSYASTIMAWNYEREEMWQFLKEISSGSDLSTVDVWSPASPLYLQQNPLLLWRMIKPLIEYANNETYIGYYYPWAPHHLGGYPWANIEPENQENMPIEETANMMIALAAIAQVMGTTDYIDERYWPLLNNWGTYLWETSEIPGDQLCTDDFEGSVRNNSNLAAKGMIGLAAFGNLLNWSGNTTGAQAYWAQASSYARFWMKEDSQGDHYGLNYSSVGTWSVKYNLIWQRVLKLNVFPEAVFDIEVAYYKTQLLEYCLPMDYRASFTMTPYMIWLASFAAPSDTTMYNTLVDGIWAMYNTTPDRVPLTDWWEANTGRQVGFRCRAVVGSVFTPLLLAQLSL